MHELKEHLALEQGKAWFGGAKQPGFGCEGMDGDGGVEYVSPKGVS